MTASDHLLPEGLLEIMRCPSCHGTLVEDVPESRLRCTQCGLMYAVEDGVPNMLIEEATRPAGT